MPAPTEDESRTPRIPNHEMLRVIGRGAYGEIWLARSVTGALRAVKIVSRRTFEDERTFAREFEGMARFEPISRAHEGFIDILDVGRDAERELFYYVMELADDLGPGDPALYLPRTVASELELRGRLPVAECLTLGLTVAEALGELHRCGFTHRDIKPANLLFVGGVPKIADIGLVAASGQRSFVGTEGYMPPEGPGTVEADLYSFGKVLYELSMGKDRLQFPAVHSELADFPDKAQLRLLNDVLLKACATDAADRYASAEALRADLLRVQAGLAPCSRRHRRLAPWFAIVGLLVVAAAIAGWSSAWRPVSSNPKTAPPAPTWPRVALTIQTEPPGAKVLFGDSLKTSPATFDDIEPGRYPLRVMLSGYDPIATRVEINGHSPPTLPPFHLERSHGALRLTSEPAGVAFELRGPNGSNGPNQVERSGTAPAEFADLPTGEYEITAHLAAAALHTRVVIESGAPTLQHLAFGNGSVKLTSAPGGARVLLDGQELGHTPLHLEDVKPGAVRYELRLPGFEAATVEGEVQPDQQLFLAARLERRRCPVAGQSWQNSLGMKFVPLGPALLSIWETRVQDYAAYLAANGRPIPPNQDPLRPVVGVSWHDADAFCQWLTAKELRDGWLREGQSYRLPTDREWSQAAGLVDEPGNTPQERDGKNRTAFPWGTQWPPPPGTGNFADRSGRRSLEKIIPDYDDGFAQTAPVGSFPPNALGLYDLAGNVWEWCLEGYKGNSQQRDWGILRGGSWANASRGELLTSYRNVVDRADHDVLYGFRCLLVPQE